jgi:uncharacterized repeat protein (TIGR03803 family)
MRSNKSQLWLTVTLSILVITLIAAATPAVAQQESVLYNFTSTGPQAGVVFDALGNLYGADASQGVYELTPQSDGTWTEKIIYNNFGANANIAGDLIFDSAGNLYGVSLSGAASDGFVFELKPSSGGSWTEETLYTFPQTGLHGNDPFAGVIMDKSGNLYGTTFYGGAYGGRNIFAAGGTVFELIPQPGGGWTQKLLHSFGNGTDGSNPNGGLIFDSAGNLYGTTTQGGGPNALGTVFELIRQSNGQWKEKILHNFGSLPYDGLSPYSKLVFDSAGNLYGTTVGGGTDSNGTVFELIPQTDGRWKEKVLLSFEGSNGADPRSALVLNSAGDLYGVTFTGGLYGGGFLYELIPGSNGTWQQSAVHNFGNGTDGSGSLGNLCFDASGNLFGTTQGGGTTGQGTVFKITF